MGLRMDSQNQTSKVENNQDSKQNISSANLKKSSVIAEKSKQIEKRSEIRSIRNNDLIEALNKETFLASSLRSNFDTNDDFARNIKRINNETSIAMNKEDGSILNNNRRPSNAQARRIESTSMEMSDMRTETYEGASKPTNEKKSFLEKAKYFITNLRWLFCISSVADESPNGSEYEGDVYHNVQLSESDHHSFADLPDGVLLKILLIMNVKDVLSASTCCKRWRHIAMSSTIWRRINFDLIPFKCICNCRSRSNSIFERRSISGDEDETKNDDVNNCFVNYYNKVKKYVKFIISIKPLITHLKFSFDILEAKESWLHLIFKFIDELNVEELTDLDITWTYTMQTRVHRQYLGDYSFGGSIESLPEFTCSQHITLNQNLQVSQFNANENQGSYIISRHGSHRDRTLHQRRRLRIFEKQLMEKVLNSFSKVKQLTLQLEWKMESINLITMWKQLELLNLKSCHDLDGVSSHFSRQESSLSSFDRSLNTDDENENYPSYHFEASLLENLLFNLPFLTSLTIEISVSRSFPELGCISLISSSLKTIDLSKCRGLTIVAIDTPLLTSLMLGQQFKTKICLAKLVKKGAPKLRNFNGTEVIEAELIDNFFLHYCACDYHKRSDEG